MPALVEGRCRRGRGRVRFAPLAAGLDILLMEAEGLFLDHEHCLLLHWELTVLSIWLIVALLP